MSDIVKRNLSDYLKGLAREIAWREDTLIDYRGRVTTVTGEIAKLTAKRDEIQSFCDKHFGEHE